MCEYDRNDSHKETSNNHKRERECVLSTNTPATHTITENNPAEGK